MLSSFTSIDALQAQQFADLGLVIGNFDGVHRGHQALINTSLNRCKTTIILTFDPHPRDFFAKKTVVPKLTQLPFKMRLFAALGVHGSLTIAFDSSLAALSADDFVARYLAPLNPRLVVVGEDFRYGTQRRGDRTHLQLAGETYGFETHFVPPQVDESGGVISSSRIREDLAVGDVGAANQLLGWRYRICGTVIHGEKRGRALGYPTLNMMVEAPHVLKQGVYATRARVDGAWFGAVSSFGVRPQFDGRHPVLETHVFGFSGDVYGQDVDIEFLSFLRGEARFDDVGALVQQMGQDAEIAKAHIASHVSGSYARHGEQILKEHRSEIVQTDLMRALDAV